MSRTKTIVGPMVIRSTTTMTVPAANSLPPVTRRKPPKTTQWVVARKRVAPRRATTDGGGCPAKTIAKLEIYRLKTLFLTMLSYSTGQLSQPHHASHKPPLILDSGASGHYLHPNSVCRNIQPAPPAVVAAPVPGLRLGDSRAMTRMTGYAPQLRSYR